MRRGVRGGQRAPGARAGRAGRRSPRRSVVFRRRPCPCTGRGRARPARSRRPAATRGAPAIRISCRAAPRSAATTVAGVEQCSQGVDADHVLGLEVDDVARQCGDAGRHRSDRLRSPARARPPRSAPAGRGGQDAVDDHVSALHADLGQLRRRSGRSRSSAERCARATSTSLVRDASVSAPTAFGVDRLAAAPVLTAGPGRRRRRRRSRKSVQSPATAAAEWCDRSGRCRR